MKVSSDKVIACIRNERDLSEEEKIFIVWFLRNRYWNSDDLVDKAVNAGFQWDRLHILNIAWYAHAAKKEITGGNK